jgi:hypothetical protein
MSWIDKELERRARATTAAITATPSGLGADSGSAMQQLWQRFEALNAALPPELRLYSAQAHDGVAPERQMQRWLQAPNGAVLGFTGDAIRYLWPEAGRRRSHNFWIRWSAERGAPELTQRVGTGLDAWRFDARRVEAVIRQLVQGERVVARKLRQRRLGIF